MNRRWWAAAVLVLALAAAVWWQIEQRARDRAFATVVIAGGDGGGLPRAVATEEHLAAAGLAGALATAQQRQLRLLLVARHGHLVLEYYASRDEAAALRDGGALSAALLAQLGDERPTDPAALASALSRQIWQPLNAGPARLADGVIQARAVDWLRLGVLLLGAGRFEGSEVTSAARIADVHYDGAPPEGEPLAAREVHALRAAGDLCLWLAPSLQLAVLQAGGQLQGEQTLLVNQVLRAIEDRGGYDAARSQLNQLVPGH